MSFLLKNEIIGHKILAGHCQQAELIWKHKWKRNIVLLKTKHLCSNAIINTCKTGTNDTSALHDLKLHMMQRNGYQLLASIKKLPHRELNRNKNEH